MLIVTAVAASILGFLYVKLALDVIGLRHKHKVSVGDGGNEDLLRAIRAQGNLAEYAPIGLFLVAGLELNGTPWWITAILAAMFVIGRLLHPIGMRNDSHSFSPRVRGMQLTLIGILALGVTNLIVVGWRLFF